MRKLTRRSKDSSNSAVAGAPDVYEQHSEKRIRDLESENDALKLEIEELRCKRGNISSGSSVCTQQYRGDHHHKSSAMKEQAMGSRSKPDMNSQCSTKNTSCSSTAKQSSDEVQKLKAQKVKLQCKIKLDSMHFRLCKASLEKEILQLKKEQRKSEFEKQVLLALNMRQKKILQLKRTQARTSMKQLKSLLESKKISLDKTIGPPKGTNIGIQYSKSEQLMTRLDKVHSSYERQMKEISEEIKKFRLEADMLKTELLEVENSPLCENRVGHSLTDSELKELKEEFNKLSTMVSKMEMTKSQLIKPDKSQGGNSAESFASAGNTDYKTSTESSPSEISLPSPQEPSQETLCATKQCKADVCCSCTKRSVCKTTKCKCRANGSGCGESCGCTASKCTNREAIPSSENDKEDATRPLHDIGNTLDVSSYAEKAAGPLKKERKRAARK